VPAERLAEEHFTLLQAHRFEVDSEHELDDAGLKLHVVESGYDKVDTLLPKSVLDLAPLALVDLVLG